MLAQPQIQSLLEELAGEGVSVYFQPPATLIMAYPCIVYMRDDLVSQHADNRPYRHTMRYSVTYIDRKPNNTITQKLAELPTSSYERFFIADNLNHDVFNIYF